MMDQEVIKGRKSNNNYAKCSNSASSAITQSEEVRRGPWTVDEDFMLINFIATHGEGRWNSLASSAGLKRTGKSCRLRWLNYLRPDVRRGNITLEEQLLILELHSRWGNRWSKIAQYLPGRTDNEIKNYWRTRVQKHAKQLKCEVNSKQFKDTMRHLWIPRLIERIQTASMATTAKATGPATNGHLIKYYSTESAAGTEVNMAPRVVIGNINEYGVTSSSTPENSTSSTAAAAAAAASSDSHASPISDLAADNCYNIQVVDNPIPHNNNNCFSCGQVGYPESSVNFSPSGYFNQGLDFQAMEQSNQWLDAADISDNLWNIVEDIWCSQQLNNNNVW